MRRSESNWNVAFMRQNWAPEEICLAPMNANERESAEEERQTNPLPERPVRYDKRLNYSKKTVGKTTVSVPFPLLLPIGWGVGGGSAGNVVFDPVDPSVTAVKIKIASGGAAGHKKAWLQHQKRQKEHPTQHS
jgi:hypothetical protein